MTCQEVVRPTDDVNQTLARLFAEVQAAGFYPDLMQESLDRTLGSRHGYYELLGYWMDSSVHLDADAGLIRQVNVTCLTDAGLFMWIGHDAPVETAGHDKSEDSRPDTSLADVHLVQFTQAVPMRRVNDVRVQTRTSNPDPKAGTQPQLEVVQVIVTTPTQEGFVATPLDCDDPHCHNPHGFSASTRNDTITLVATRDGLQDEKMDELLTFAGLLERQLLQ